MCTPKQMTLNHLTAEQASSVSFSVLITCVARVCPVCRGTLYMVLRARVQALVCCTSLHYYKALSILRVYHVVPCYTSALAFGIPYGSAGLCFRFWGKLHVHACALCLWALAAGTMLAGGVGTALLFCMCMIPTRSSCSVIP